MKTINYKKESCYAEDIPIGECFIYYGELFMATEKLRDNTGDDIVCVNLTNGTIPSSSYIDSKTTVIPVNINIDVL